MHRSASGTYLPYQHAERVGERRSSADVRVHHSFVSASLPADLKTKLHELQRRMTTDNVIKRCAAESSLCYKRHFEVGYTGNLMASRYVYKLDKKISSCIDVLHEAEELANSTKSDFYKRLGGKPTTWSSAFRKHRLTEQLEHTLSKVCRFDLHPFWIDANKSDDERRLGGANYTGRDTPAAFLRMLRGAWNLPVDPGLALESKQPKTTDALFASFTLLDTGQTSSTDSAMLAFLEVDIGLFQHEDDATGELLTYGFNKVILQLVLGDDTKIVNRLATADDLDGATLCMRGTSRDPRWELIISDGLLNRLYFTKTPLFEVVDPEEGQSFKACLKASVNDGSLRRADGARPFGIEKQRLLELFMARGFGINKKGFITLGVQQITIVKRI
jgi:hypothetical protein